jgi:hypothetical protein
MKRGKRNPASVPDILAEDGTERGHEAQLAEYSRHKARSIALCNILKQKSEYRKEYDNLDACGSFLHYWHFFETGEWKLRGGITCKMHLLCGCCGRRRSIRYSSSYAEKVQHLLAQRPELTPVLITLTVKNGNDLDECWNRLDSGHKVLIQRRRSSIKPQLLSRINNLSVMRYIAGAAGTYEFKRGKNSGLWHPHSHEIALLEPGFEFVKIFRNGRWVEVPLEFETALSAEWTEATGGSWRVDVRRIDMASEESFMGGLLEVFSYTLKISSLSPEDQLHAYTVLKRRRLIYSYGCLRNVDIPDESVDLVGDELKFQKYFDVWYKYNRRSGHYAIELDMSNFEPQVYKGIQVKPKRKRNKAREMTVISRQEIKDWLSLGGRI